MVYMPLQAVKSDCESKEGYESLGREIVTAKIWGNISLSVPETDEPHNEWKNGGWELRSLTSTGVF